MRIVVFGAGGPTGRHLVHRAVVAGHDVTAVLRRSGGPGSGPDVRTVIADATDHAAVDRVVAGHDAVLSGLGARPSRHAVTLYSASTAAFLAAMRRHGTTRLIVISSSVLDPGWRPSGEFVFNTVIDPLINRRIARTAHEDMRRMEAQLGDSDLDWTVVRPSGLFDHPEVTGYRTEPDVADGLYTARVDLAAAMVTELTARRFVHRPMAVITTDVRPSVGALMWRETVGRRREARSGA